MKMAAMMAFLDKFLSEDGKKPGIRLALDRPYFGPTQALLKTHLRRGDKVAGGCYFTTIKRND